MSASRVPQPQQKQQPHQQQQQQQRKRRRHQYTQMPQHSHSQNQNRGVTKRQSPGSSTKIVAQMFQQAQADILDQQQPSTSATVTHGNVLRERNQMTQWQSENNLRVAAQRRALQTRSVDSIEINPSFRQRPPTEPDLLKYRQHTPILPRAAWSNTQTVWNLMCWKDGAYKKCSTYLAKHGEITEKMRAILIDWMSEVCEVYKLHRETLYLAIDIFDRFMSKSDNVAKTRLQLIGVTALFIAAKIEEIYPPKITEFAYVTDGACKESEIQQVEMIVLKTIGWSLSPVTAVHWLAVYLQVAENHLKLQNEKMEAASPAVTPTVTEFSQSSSKCFKRQLFGDRPPTVDCMSLPKFHRQTFVSLCQLLDLACLDAGWLNHSYGVLAAAAIYCLADNPQIALQVSGYSISDLARCVEFMRPFAEVCRNELAEPQIRVVQGVLADDLYNIQSHTVGMAQLTLVHQLNARRHQQAIAKTQFTIGQTALLPVQPSTPHTPLLDASSKVFNTAFPTPPSSGSSGTRSNTTPMDQEEIMGATKTNKPLRRVPHVETMDAAV